MEDDIIVFHTSLCFEVHIRNQPGIDFIVTKICDDLQPANQLDPSVKDPRFQPIKAIKFVPILRVELWPEVGPTWKLIWFIQVGPRGEVADQVTSPKWRRSFLGGGSWATRCSWWQPEIWPENQLRERYSLWHDLHGFSTIPGGCLGFPLSTVQTHKIPWDYHSAAFLSCKANLQISLTLGWWEWSHEVMKFVFLCSL